MMISNFFFLLETLFHFVKSNLNNLLVQPSIDYHTGEHDKGNTKRKKKMKGSIFIRNYMLLINQYRRQRRVGDINNFNPCPNDILSPSSIYLLYTRLQFNQFNLYLIIDTCLSEVRANE